MTTFTTNGSSAAKSADLMTPLSTMANQATPVQGLDSLTMNLIWAEIAQIARFGEIMMPNLLLAKPYQVYAGNWGLASNGQPTWLTGTCFVPGTTDLGPFKLPGQSLVASTWNSSVQANPNPTAYIAYGSTTISMPVDDSNGAVISTVTATPQVCFGGLMYASQQLLDTTMSVFNNLYNQLHRSDGTIPPDIVTMSRAASLFSGTNQKVISNWASGPINYWGTNLNQAEIAASSAISATLGPAMFQSLAPLTYAAIKNGTTPLV